MVSQQLDLLYKGQKPVYIRGDWPYYAASAMVAILTGAHDTVKPPRYFLQSGGLASACERMGKRTGFSEQIPPCHDSEPPAKPHRRLSAPQFQRCSAAG